MSAVFVDTSALYALFATSDANHAAAIATLRELKRLRSSLITTDLVLFEAYVLVHARGGLGSLLEFRKAMVKSVWLQQIPTAPEQQEQAWDLLERRKDKGYSLVDAVSFVVMRELGIRQAFGFDAHFAQEGFEMLGNRQGRR